jgi:hypothetical protein
MEISQLDPFSRPFFYRRAFREPEGVMRLLLSAAALSLILATSVSARPAPDQPTAQPSSNPAPAPASAKKKDGVICRKEIPTGSQFPVKVCTTPDQRSAQRSATHRAQEVMQRPSEVVPQ